MYRRHFNVVLNFCIGMLFLNETEILKNLDHHLLVVSRMISEIKYVRVFKNLFLTGN